MMAALGVIITMVGFITENNTLAICGTLIMCSGYLGLVIDNFQSLLKKKLELIKILIDNLRK